MSGATAGRSTLTARLARWRVALGFVCGALAVWLAQPTASTVAVGGAVAVIGELLRVWAAGHVEKSREVTRSGPYRFTRHPLYLGSSIIGLGMGIASGSVIVVGLVLVYLGTTVTAAIRAEEAHLRDKFGAAYDDYATRRAAPMVRRWSLARALGNREHHTIAGLLAVLAIFWLIVQSGVR